jgi:hypothetical protein
LRESGRGAPRGRGLAPLRAPHLPVCEPIPDLAEQNPCAGRFAVRADGEAVCARFICGAP